MADEDDEEREVTKARAQAIESLKGRVLNDNENKSKQKMLGQLRERLIDQVIMLGEHIPSPPANDAQLKVSSHHATAISGYLDAVTKIDSILKTMTSRL
jgi:hypothetical protein